MNPFIVFTMLLVPSLCNDPPLPDWGSPEEFLKEVNEYRAKFAKERKIPNMYKLTWSDEVYERYRSAAINGQVIPSFRNFFMETYQNVTENFNKKINHFKKDLDENSLQYLPFWGSAYLDLLNPLHTFIGCKRFLCVMGHSGTLNLWYANPGEAGSRCPPRFKGENGLCVPVDPTKHTYWGSEDQLLEDVNYMRRKYAKEFGIPNMHQLTWNETLVEALNGLNVDFGYVEFKTIQFLAANDSSWDGVGKNWRVTELQTFSAAVAVIDEDVHVEHVLKTLEVRRSLIRGNKENISQTEFIHPLQTSIGCMKKERINYDNEREHVTSCLLGNLGQWPTNWKIDVNSKKIPGSECMDGYVNDDGLCVLAPPILPVQNIPKEPEASEALESEQEETESSSTSELSYGLWILYFILFIF